MNRRRLKQQNLVGPAGFISMEDGCVGGFVQRGTAAAEDKASVVEMGGSTTESQATRATEASVRGFWKAYRRHMGYWRRWSSRAVCHPERSEGSHDDRHPRACRSAIWSFASLRTAEEESWTSPTSLN